MPRPGAPGYPFGKMPPLHDVFISHASEDKAAVARPLAERMRGAGLEVWLDERQLRVGHSLPGTIDGALARSRFGVVILSPAFFRKDWPRRELDALLAMESSREKVVLPVWHGVTRDDVLAYSPILASKLAVSTDEGMHAVGEALIEAIRGEGAEALPDEPLAPPAQGPDLPLLFPALYEEPERLVGRTVRRYRIEDVLGKGGSGIAFVARHLPTQRRLCFKLFFPLQGPARSIAGAVHRAVRGLSRIDHPSIALLHDFGSLAYGESESFFLATQLLEGPALDGWSRALKGDRPGLLRRLEAAQKIVDALALAHEVRFVDEVGFEQRGMLHGDLKPANVLMHQGRPVITDFLMVDVQRLLDPRVVPEHLLRGPEDDVALTRAFGTPGYMAPEQVEEGIVTRASDVYSLGVTLREVLSPTRPLMPSTLTTLLSSMVSSVVDDRPGEMAEVARSLEEIRRNMTRE